MSIKKEVPEKVDWYDSAEHDIEAGIFSEEDVSLESWEEARDFRSEEGIEPPVAKGKSLSPKMLAMRKLGRESRVPRKIWLKLLAASELDDIRGAENKIGMGLLFEAFCENANKLWLDPLEELKPIIENLEKFQGEIRHLRSFIYLMVQLSREKISPGAFLRFVLRPRMNFDYNFRNWREKNFWALEKIALGLMELRKERPFHEVFLGKSRALVEQVLAKYVGKPLARFRTTELDQDANLDAYFQVWSKLTFENVFFLQFCRVNVFPFFYRLSGKIDLVQLVSVVKILLSLEKAFSKGLPHATTYTHESVLSFSLYTDFEANMTARNDKGLGPYDMVRELKAFLLCVNELLNTNAGVFLTSWLSGFFHAEKDPDFAESVSLLIPLLKDSGGMDLYRWHIVALSKAVPSARPDFLREVEVHGGRHPRYKEAYTWGPPEPKTYLHISSGLLSAAKASSLSITWNRILPERREPNGEVFGAARQKIRMDFWEHSWRSLSSVPETKIDFRNMIPLLQNDINLGEKLLKQSKEALILRDSEELKTRIQRITQSLKLPAVLLKNIDFFNPGEGILALILAAGRFGKPGNSWNNLGLQCCAQLLLAPEHQTPMDFLIKDIALERPTEHHLGWVVWLGYKALENVWTSWDKVTQHLRPKVRELLSYFVLEPSWGFGPEAFQEAVRRIFSLDAINFDRSRFTDAMTTMMRSKSEEKIQIRFWESDEPKKGALYTGAFLVSGNLIALAHLGPTTPGNSIHYLLEKIDIAPEISVIWGQNDFLRLYAHFRKLWEDFFLQKEWGLGLIEKQWQWVGLQELSDAITVWEKKLGARSLTLKSSDGKVQKVLGFAGKGLDRKSRNMLDIIG